MKKTITLFFISFLFVLSNFAQSKKIQIETLTHKVDSLEQVIAKERKITKDKVTELQEEVLQINKEKTSAIDGLIKIKNDFTEVNSILNKVQKQNTELSSLNIVLNDSLIFFKKKLLDFYIIQSAKKATVRHILLKAKGDDEMAAAKDKADSIIRVIRANNNFEEMVTEFSEDPGSINNGGRYEYFTEGIMVPEFNDFSFNEPIGKMGIFETYYGLHIAEVLERKSYNLYVLDTAKIEKILLSSDKYGFLPLGNDYIENDYNKILGKIKNTPSKSKTNYIEWLESVINKYYDSNGNDSFMTSRCLSYALDAVSATWDYNGSISRATFRKKWENIYDVDKASFGHLFTYGNDGPKFDKITIKNIGKLNNGEWFLVKLIFNNGKSLDRVIKIIDRNGILYIDNFISLSND